MRVRGRCEYADTRDRTFNRRTAEGLDREADKRENEERDAMEFHRMVIWQRFRMASGTIYS